MLTAINARTFPQRLSTAEQLAAAAKAGFLGIELALELTGPLTFHTSLGDCKSIADQARDLGLSIAGLTTSEFWTSNYADPDKAARERAIDFTVRMLDRAAALDAKAIVVLPAVVGAPDDPRPRVRYAEALHRSFDALLCLRHEAESRGVTIALENAQNRFLLSPMEAVEFVDRVNSPHVGWCLNTGDLTPFGYPVDWIISLGRRIAHVHVTDRDAQQPGDYRPLGEGSIDWPELIAALRKVGYAGPLAYQGPGEPNEICRRLEAIMNERAVERREGL